MDIQECNITIQMHEMTPSNCEILLCTCVDLVVEKEILSVASLHLLSNLYSWQPRSHTSTTVCIVFGLFSVQGLTQLSILDLCFSLCAFFCHCRSLWRTNVMLCLWCYYYFMSLSFYSWCLLLLNLNCVLPAHTHVHSPNPSLSPWQHNDQPQAIQTTFCNTTQQAPLNIYPTYRQGRYDNIYYATVRMHRR